MTDASGRTTYTYDAAGRLSTQTAPAGKTITYSYDAVGNRATMVDPDGGTTTYSFDAGRRLSSLVNPLSERTTWQYDPVGRITTLTHANATRAVHTYNAAGWVTGLVNAKSDGTTLTSHDYTYDALGSPTLLAVASVSIVCFPLRGVVAPLGLHAPGLCTLDNVSSFGYGLAVSTWDSAGGAVVEIAAWIAVGLLAVVCVLVLLALARAFMKFAPPPDAGWVDNTNEKNKSDLIAHLKAARNDVVILCGHLRGEVYDACVAKKITEATGRRVRVRIVSARPEEPGANAVWNLATSGEMPTNRFEIRTHDRAPSFGHFRVRDARYYTLEKPAPKSQEYKEDRIITDAALEDRMSAGYLLSFFHDLWFQAHTVRPPSVAPTATTPTGIDTPSSTGQPPAHPG
jgi:YD repeat-containing protein